MKTTLILTGGGSGGAFQVGVLKILVKKNIIPDVILAVSVGSLNGVKLASSPNIKKNIKELEEIWLNGDNHRTSFPKKLKFNSVIPSFHSIEGLRDIVHKNLDVRNFEELSIPLHIHTITHKEKKDVFFNKGNLIDAVLASCSVIPLFPAYEINNVKYVDGHTNKHSILKKAASIRCDRVILVDSTPLKPKYFKNSNLIRNLKKMFNNKSIEDNINEFEKKIITIRPTKKFKVSKTSFKYTSELIKEGEIQAEEILKNFH